MAVALEQVFRRGAVFLWTTFAQLDDPALAGSTKPKFIVMLSGSAHDEPLYYILTTSEKPKTTSHPHPQDLFAIPSGTYPWFPLNTILDTGSAGELTVESDEFAALYARGEVIYKGALSDHDVAALVVKIKNSLRVNRRFKQVLGG
jgi:hypothetical protein